MCKEIIPHAGHSTQALTDGSADGKTRVLWDNANGTLSLWGLDNSIAAFTHFGRSIHAL